MHNESTLRYRHAVALIMLYIKPALQDSRSLTIHGRYIYTCYMSICSVFSLFCGVALMHVLVETKTHGQDISADLLCIRSTLPGGDYSGRPPSLGGTIVAVHPHWGDYSGLCNQVSLQCLITKQETSLCDQILYSVRPNLAVAPKLQAFRVALMRLPICCLGNRHLRFESDCSNTENSIM